MGTNNSSNYSPTQYTVQVGGASGTLANVGPGSSGQILQSAGGSANPAYSTATYPSTTTANQILYSSATNTVGGLTTANNSVVLTNGSGVPSLGNSLTNDFTFTSSTAGATRTLTVSNTDNTNSSSTAIIKASTGGSSAGDGVFQASTTVTTWSFGVDNSVTSPTADPFVIAQGTALGTNNIMSADTSGAINYPLQPAFYAVLPTSDSNVTGDGTTYTLGSGNALTIVFDQASNMTTGGTFTAPVTGKYGFTFCIQCNSLAAGMTGGFAQIVTTSRTYQFGAINWGAVRTAANSNGITGAFLASMTAGDTATFTLAITGGSKVAQVLGNSSGSDRSYVSGWLHA